MLMHDDPGHDNLEADFDRDGVVILDLDIDPALCARVVAATCRSEQSPLDLWQTSPAIIELAFYPAIVAVLRRLYQREPFPFQTLNYHHSPQQGIHSDMIHFNSLPMGFMCGVWIALEEVTVDNGPLFYYPGSHKLPFVTFQDLQLTPSTDDEQLHKNLGHYSQWLQNFVQQRGLKRELFCCRPGQVLIWAANLLHGSINKVVERSRISQVTHYFFTGCKYYTPAYSTPERYHWRDPYDLVKQQSVNRQDAWPSESPPRHTWF
jgi:ectoine hydroxylase-related dioxygenase (phytanoyl-CoA dioxygenase family)